MHAQRHFAGARGEQRDIAGELQRIAKTLLGLNIDVLAGEAFALPRLFGKSRAVALARAQPPFVFVPAFGEIAAHQQQNAEARMGIGVMRRERDGAAQRRDAFLEVAVMMQRGAEIGPAVGIVGLELDGAAIRADGFVELPQRLQRIAEIAMRFGEIRIGRDGLALGARGLLVILQFVKRDAEIAQRRRAFSGSISSARRAGATASRGRPARRSISPRLA